MKQVQHGHCGPVNRTAITLELRFHNGLSHEDYESVDVVILNVKFKLQCKSPSKGVGGPIHFGQLQNSKMLFVEFKRSVETTLEPPGVESSGTES